MKKSISSALTIIISMISAIQSLAVPANPSPVQVTQPDGSVLTIKVHGDEFLNWTTCGHSLVAMGTDGFYHFASFDAEGRSLASGARVTSTPGGDGTSVMPPRSAFRKAEMTKNEWSERARSIRRKAAERYAVTGEDHFLVMLIDFDDLRFSVTDAADAFSRMLNQEGYSEHQGTGSARDYFSDQSTELFKPHFDVRGPYTVEDKMSTYTEEDGCTQNGAPRLLAEACTISNPEIDFSQYDHDMDGYIDNIFFFYAGYCAASGNKGTIWPHSWAVGGNYIFDGVILYGYACASEYDGTQGSKQMASIGTFCHEFGHTLGLPDFYDTDYETGGEGYGLGHYSLMSSGCYNNKEKTPPFFNCEERMLLGWMTSVPPLPTKNTTVTLKPVQGNNGYISPTDNDGEYFYYEYRNKTGWDNSPQIMSGLIIYHIDKSSNIVNGTTAQNRWSSGYGINAYASHECFKVMRANEDNDIVPFGNGYNSFTSETKPAAKAWDSKATGYDLKNIAHNGTQASFYLFCADADMFPELGICAIRTEGIWKDGDDFPLKLVETENNPSSVEWYFDGDKVTESPIKLSSGTHTVKAEVKWSSGESGYYESLLHVQ